MNLTTILPFNHNKELLETGPVPDFYKKQQETRNDLETTRPNVSKKIRNDCTKTQNRD